MFGKVKYYGEKKASTTETYVLMGKKDHVLFNKKICMISANMHNKPLI
jgi:hypothetical protein